MMILQIEMPGGPESLVILVIVLLIIGANKIPKLAQSTGEAISEFQKGRREVEEELQAMRDTGSGLNESSSESSATHETPTETTGGVTETEIHNDDSGTDGDTDSQTQVYEGAGGGDTGGNDERRIYDDSDNQK